MEKLSIVYADNAATTAMSRTAVEAMLPYLDKIYGNPSSLHSVGQVAKEALEVARADMAACLGAKPDEIYFTSCGSESDNQAIRSAAHLGALKGKKHIISTAFEHHAVLHTLKRLEKEEGFEVTLLDVHANGVITADEVKAAIRPDTCLVTVMFANNEIGTVQPIKEIGEVCRAAGVKVSPVPGPCAFVSALCASGLPSDSFLFAGFLPPKASARRAYFGKYADFPHSLIFYESPYRIEKFAADALEIFGENRAACFAKEITKFYERFFVGKLGGVCGELKSASTKGEFTVIIAPRGFEL